MKKRILLEDIYNIILNESLGAGLSNLLKKLGKSFNDDFLRSLGKNADELAKLEPNQISRLIKNSVDPNMVRMRKDMADYLIDTKFKDINFILKKYDDLSIPQQSMEAGRELSSKLGIEPGILRDVNKAWAAKKATYATASTAGTTSTTAGTTAATTAGSTIRTISQIEIDNLIKNNVKLYFPDITPKSWYSFLTKYGKPMKDRMMAATSGMANVNTEAEVSVLLNDIVNQMSKTKDKTLKVKLKNMSVAAKQKGNRPLTESNRKSYILWIAIAAAVIFVYNKISSGISDFWGEKTSPDTEGGLIDKYLPGVIDAIQGSGDTTNTAPPTNKLKDKWGLQ